MPLTDWGVPPPETLAPGETLARVVEEQKTQYLLALGEAVVPAQLPGKLLRASRLERPVVGDWVVAQALPGEGRAVVRRLLPRASLLRRKAAGETEEIQPLAANVDLAVIVTSLNREFNENRLHRYLTVVRESGARAAVVLTKSDLEPESRATAERLAATYGVPCLALCALRAEGLGEVRALWGPGETAVFVGSSGVGKSTLVNALLGRAEQAVGHIREEDDRARHTTTSRRLLPLPSGALVIDTPGMREIQLEAAHGEGLTEQFAEIEELARGCRFGDCSHASEPGCAVKAARDAGALAPELLENYRKLKAEVAARERRPPKGSKSQRKPR